MLKNILNYRANIWLTAGAIILIFGFLISIIVITSEIDPLSADARMQSPYIEKSDRHLWNYIPGFGRSRSDYTYPSSPKEASPTRPSEENTGSKYDPNWTGSPHR